MLAVAKNPTTGDQKPRPKSARKPLQPKNIQSPSLAELTKPKPKPNKLDRIQISPAPVIPPAPAKIETFDASLAEELSAIKKRLERLRLDSDRTEIALREKDSILDQKRTEIDRRGEIQKRLEIEVDRLYRLNQLHSQAMVRFSPIQSLREKERTKAVSESESKENVNKTEVKEESVGESSLEDLTSTASSSI